MKKWEYGGAYKHHDMEGRIDLPNGSTVQVWDITEGLPAFMQRADVLFIDPPCSQGNMQSFYTKADLAPPMDYQRFSKALFEHVATIAPKHLFLELFAANETEYINKALRLFKHMVPYDSFYYKKRSNKCKVVHFSNEPIAGMLGFNGIDEERFIQKLCAEFDYDCIGDLCMGTGLVGWYAYRAGNSFVGTELNKKRLAMLLERIRYKEAKSDAGRKCLMP